jgi:hypothetical protein
MSMPDFLKAAQLYQPSNSGILSGFNQGVTGVSGILQNIQNQKKLQLQQQEDELQAKADAEKQQALMDYRNSQLGMLQQNVDINKERLARMGELTPYQQGQLDLAKQRLALEKAKGSTTTESQKARAKYYEKMTDSMDYRSLPIDQKSALLAQASGMGYDPNEATTLLMKGNNLRDLAKNAGFDPENMPDAIYPATKSDVAKINQRKAALSEINTLNPVISSALAPYSRSIMGYSPKQVSEAISNTDPDAQARFLAAKALIPELSAIRLKAMQGSQIGIEAMKEVTNASMSNVKAYKSLVSPEVFEQMNKYIDSWVTQAADSANRVNLGTFSRQEQARSGGAAAPQQKTEAVKTPNNTPTLSTFLTAAKKANPSATDKELIDYYNKKYGGK